MNFTINTHKLRSVLTRNKIKKMKKTHLVTVAFIAMIAISCKKEDNIQPVITLNGSYEQSVDLNGTYNEAGATAKDNQDGDITSSIVITGTVNTNETGEYRVYYDVADSEDNKAATATRFVTVSNSSDYMVGTYQATPNCSGTSTFNTYNTTVTSSTTTNNQIFIKRVMWQVEDEPVIGNVSGNTIDIPLQTIGQNTVSGSATITGSSFLLTININGWQTYSCTIDHVKI